jgi:hypothetical protein
MLSTSAVAVWCSSASRNSALRSPSSLNKRTFSIAMTGLIGEGFQERDLLVSERTDLRAANHYHADWDTFTQ